MKVLRCSCPMASAALGTALRGPPTLRNRYRQVVAAMLLGAVGLPGITDAVAAQETNRMAPVQSNASGGNNAEGVQRTVEEPPRGSERTGVALVPEMVRIKGGCFRMGSPESEVGRDTDEIPHRVCVDDFSIGKYEVTFEEFDRYVEATEDALRPDDWGWGRGRRPVIDVHWNRARRYAEWLSRQKGRRYRLPTEAEWEYAARGGRETARHWGDDPGPACTYANVADRTLAERYPGSQWQWRGVESEWRWSMIHPCRDGYAETAPVGSYRANGYGLHDMLGNVWEWTCSQYGEDFGEGVERSCASRSPPCGSSKECRERRLRPVIRGGAWGTEPRWIRSATRTSSDPGARYATLGFRVVLSD